MSSLSSPAPVGDHEALSFEENAKAALDQSLYLISKESGPHVKALADDVLLVLADNDGMRWADVKAAVEESRSVRLLETTLLDRGIRALLERQVIHEADERLSLNPAVAALIGRDVE